MGLTICRRRSNRLRYVCSVYGYCQDIDGSLQGVVLFLSRLTIYSLDTDRDGFITIGFEQFLEIILRQR